MKQTIIIIAALLTLSSFALPPGSASKFKQMQSHEKYSIDEFFKPGQSKIKMATFKVDACKHDLFETTSISVTQGGRFDFFNAEIVDSDLARTPCFIHAIKESKIYKNFMRFLDDSNEGDKKECYVLVEKPSVDLLKGGRFCWLRDFMAAEDYESLKLKPVKPKNHLSGSDKNKNQDSDEEFGIKKSSWEISERKDEMTDAVTYSLICQGKRVSGPEKSETAMFVMVAKKGKQYNALVTLGSSEGFAYSSKSYVKVRFDEDRAYDCGTFRGVDSYKFTILKDGNDLANKMLKHKKLLVRYAAIFDKMITVEFPLDDFKPKFEELKKRIKE